MGNKGAKNTAKTQQKLSKKDITFLAGQTGLNQSEIENIFQKFIANNPDQKLDKKEFVRLYDELRPESADVLDEISNYVFDSFDKDNNGTITFNEFVIAFALTSRGDPAKKLDFAFDVYDSDNNGSLDSNELKTVLYGMLDMLGADRKSFDSKALASQIMKDLDSSHDGRISKGLL